MWSNSHWKQTGDWRTDSCTAKAVRKTHTESGRKGREVVRSGPAHLGGDTEEEEDYMGSEILPVERAVQATYWAPQLGGASPLSWFENQWDGQWSCKKPTLCSWRTCTHTCSLLKQGRGSKMRLSGTLTSSLQLLQHAPQPEPQPEPSVRSRPSCSVAQLHTRTRADGTKGSAQLWRMEPTRTQHGIVTGWGWSLLAPMEATDLELWLGPGRPQPIPWPLLNVHTSLSCSSTAPLWGEGAGTGRGESTQWEGLEPAQIRPLELLLQQLRTWPHSQKSPVGHWAVEKPRLTPGSGTSPSISSPTSYQGDSCQHTLGEDMTHAHVRYSSPHKATGHTQTV